ncbi:hypothetical protein P7K49_002602 [Saguinus oedipus]|uniref:Rho-GAP domain-containing protein n=1 Tax=Saguinus oedipus TaxID=9490 RepID=A0ABQ9WHV1_SAGOE|nr:hypothetical protein P7K49_002602 [Saguinus oedipus]
MRESPSPPATMQGLLRYFHPSWAGRSRAASTEKHLRARGTTLWTHIRNLVLKGKVGRHVGCGSSGHLDRRAGDFGIPRNADGACAPRKAGDKAFTNGAHVEGAEGGGVLSPRQQGSGSSGALGSRGVWQTPFLLYLSAFDGYAGCSWALPLTKLDPQALQDRDWQRTVITMNGIEVKLSVKFTSREFSLKRMPSRKQTGVFGVKIAVVTKRERSKVPYVVRQCVEEIERRGMEEVGIYRVSGVATDIQALKAAFDVNNKDVSVMMSEMDVNAIAGTLKLYFRELPEPLFTDEFYPNFAEGIEKEAVNKMSLHNLATVFGPTLLRPSEKESKLPANPSQPITMTDSWSLEVMSQVQVLLYFLQLEAIPAPDSKRQSILFSTEV